MSEQNTETESLDLVEAPDAAGKAGREAAKYRRQLRETEVERDQLRASLDTARQSLLTKSLSDYMSVEYIPTEGNIPQTPDGQPQPQAAKIRLKHATDFATFSGETIDTLLSDDGSLDDTKVQGALVKLWQQRPELFDDATPGAVPTIGQTPHRLAEAGGGFTSAFTPKK